MLLPVRIHDILTDLNASTMYVDSERFRDRWSLTALLMVSLGLIGGSGLVAAVYETTAATDVADRGLLFPLLMGPVGIAGLVGVVIASIRFIGPLVTLPFAYLGMIIMGRLVGLRAGLIGLGPLLFLRTHDRIETIRHDSVQISRTGMLAFETVDRRPTARDIMVMQSGLIAGSVLNIIVVFPLFLGSTLLWLHGPQPLAYLTLFTSIMTLVSLILAVLMSIQGLQRLRQIDTSNEQAEAEAVIIQAGSLLLQETRPRDFPPDLVQDLAALSSYSTIAPFEAYLLNYFLYLVLMDAGEIEHAAIRLQTGIEHLDSLPEKQRILLLSSTVVEIYDEAAYFFGFHRRDAASASGWLLRSDEAALPGRQLRLAGEAAALFAMGELGEARRRAIRAVELCEMGKNVGNSTYITDRMQNLITVIDGGQPDRTEIGAPGNIASSQSG